MKPDPGAFLRDVSAEPWRVAWSDCIGVVARWLALTGRPGATALLPPPGDDAAVEAHLARCGGLEGAVHEGMGRLGLVLVGAPAVGDVAYLALKDGRGTAAIYLGACWGARTKAGLALIRPSLVETATIWGAGHGD